MAYNFEKLEELLKEKGVGQDDIADIIAPLRKMAEKRRYGLVWEEQEEDIEKSLKDRYTVLREVEEREIKLDEGGRTHSLIEGDNLEALTFLKNSGKKVDVIYIDPPYNTLNKDFIYNDHYVDKEDAWRHSKWLSFMNKRLVLARELLTDDGVIFISIDDNEMAQLKLLCDHIYGEDNFIANICVELSKTQGMKVKSAQMGNIVKNHEYILVYTKNINTGKIDRKPLYDSTTPYDNHFKFIVENGVIISLVDYINSDNDLLNEFNKRDMKVSYHNINRILELSDEFKDVFFNEIAKKLYRMSMIKSQKIQDLPIEIGRVVEYEKYLLVKNSKGTVEQLQSFYDSLQLTDDYKPEFTRSTIRGALWKGFYSDMMNVAKEANTEFKNGKKPKRLIKQLVKWANRPNGVVLDFFAGSGTTGHSVLELNKEDGGHRQFILCTNNENNIAEEVTYERIKRVMEGYTTPKGKTVEGIPGNLRYFKVDSVDADEDIYTLEDNLLEVVVPFIQFQEDAWAITTDKPGFTYLDGRVTIYNDPYHLDEDFLDHIRGDVFYIYDGWMDYLDIEELKDIRVVPIPKEFFKLFR